jgi:peptide chain release factor 3
MRDIPIFTFINKLDRPSRDPLELIDEIEKELGLTVYAVTWAIGEGETFQGIYNRLTGNVHLYERNPRGQKQAKERIISLEDAVLETIIGEKPLRALKDDLEILDGAGGALDRKAILSGKTSPVFFGSAMTNFGVEPFLEAFLQFSAAPGAHESSVGLIQPDNPEFSGFVFKLQANMDPRHRDCLAFVRICSGKFEKDMTVTNARTGKKIRLTRPQKVFARERESMDEGFPGDVVGLNNPGAFAIGDTIYTGQKIVYPQIPTFSPELFARLRNPNTSLAKKFQKGIAQLEEEGAVQILHPQKGGASQEPVVAAVGELQFEVAQYRLKNEYGVETRLESIPYMAARWVNAGWDVLLNGEPLYETDIYQDYRQRPVLLFRSKWHLERVEKDRPELNLSSVGN